jgi:hypothetical protein
MNERMIELALQAEDYAFDEISNLESSVEPVISNRVFFKSFKEKFAEMIVREMLQTCEDHPGWSGRMISEQIKQHFGVE